MMLKMDYRYATGTVLVPPVAVMVNKLGDEKPITVEILIGPASVLTLLCFVPESVVIEIPPLLASKSTDPLLAYMAVPLIAWPLLQALLARSLTLLLALSVPKVMPPVRASASM